MYNRLEKEARKIGFLVNEGNDPKSYASSSISYW
jgi:hypothetical protein